MIPDDTFEESRKWLLKVFNNKKDGIPAWLWEGVQPARDPRDPFGHARKAMADLHKQGKISNDMRDAMQPSPPGSKIRTWNNPKAIEAEAKAGDNESQKMMCGIFTMGSKLKPDHYKNAVKWCGPDALDGNVHSARLLSRIYALGGGGIKRSVPESYFWMAISMAQKHVNYKDMVAAAKNIPSAERTEVERRVQEWRQSYCARPVGKRITNDLRCAKGG